MNRGLKLLSVVIFWALPLPAIATTLPAAVSEVTFVSTVTSGDFHSNPQISLSGYSVSGDGAEGIFKVTNSPTGTVGGTATLNSKIITVLSVSPITQGWQIGEKISDNGGKVPTETYITALSATSISVTNALTGNAVGDTFTATCPTNAGVFLKDSVGTCFRRTNISGDMRQWGITPGSVYDATATALNTNPADSGQIMRNAFAILASNGIRTLSLSTSIYWDNPTPSVDYPFDIPVSSSINCQSTGNGPYTGGVYYGKPATIFLRHNTYPHFASVADSSGLYNCMVLPEWYRNPAQAVSDCSYAGNPGIAYNNPVFTYSDMEAIRANAIICGDQGLFVDVASSGLSKNLMILGFNNPMHVLKADHSIFGPVRVDGPISYYIEQGGGLTHFVQADADDFLTKQVYTNGGVQGTDRSCAQSGLGGTQVCNFEYWQMSAIVPSSTLNSFGRPVCRITLTPGTPSGSWNVAPPLADIPTNNALYLRDVQGNPINYDSYMFNLSTATGAISCLGHGPYAPQFVSSVPGVSVTLDMLGSDWGTGANKITATATWDACSTPPCTIRIVSGNTNAMQVGELVAGTDIPVGSIVQMVSLNANGPDRYDGYIAEVQIDHALIVAHNSGADTAITFDSNPLGVSGGYQPSGNCNNAGIGQCMGWNAAEYVYSNINTTAGAVAARLPQSHNVPYAVGVLNNGVAGLSMDEPFIYGHQFDFMGQDANSFNLTNMDGDENGELDNQGLIFFSANGSSNQISILGNGGGKSGVDLMNNLWTVNDNNSFEATFTGASAGTGVVVTLTSGNFNSWPTDQGVGVQFGKMTVGLCQTPDASGGCAGKGSSGEEFVTGEILSPTTMILNARGRFFGVYPAAYTSGATIVFVTVSRPTGCTSVVNIPVSVTNPGLNSLESLGGCLQLANTKMPQAKNAFFSANTTIAQLSNSDFHNTTVYYENPSVPALLSGCGNAFLVTQIWECNKGGVINGSFTPAGATTPTSLPNFGDRALSILDFGGVPDWTTNSTTALVAAESAALAQGVHNIRLDCNAVGCGYVFNNHTVSPGIKLICPSVKAVDSSTNDYRNFPNALIMTGTNGFTFSGSGEDGCNILQQNLATSAPPATVQDLYARQASFTGTGVKCTGVCSITNSMILGFDSDVILTRSARTLDLANLQLDGNKYINVQGQGPGGVDTITGIFGAPFTTRNNPLNVFTIPLTAVGDNGAGELRVSFASCTTANCPLNGYKIWIRQPNGSQSAQGPWVLENVTATTADLVGSISAFNTGGYASTGAIVTAGSTKIVLSSTVHTQQMEPTQNVTASTCIPAGAQIAAVWRNYGIIYLDAAHPATCSTTETVTIADDSTGTFSVSTATLNAAGTNYQAGDELTLVGGTYPDPSNPTPAIILINNGGVDPTTGAILANGFTIEDGGSYTVLPGPTGVTVTGGSGTSATFNVSQAGGMVLDSSIRPGPGIGIVAVNSMNISGVNLLGGSPAISFGSQASGVKMINIKVNDENYLQDQTHIGIQFAGSSFSNSITNCGVYVFGYGLLSNTGFSGSSASPNSLNSCKLGGVNGASGLQGVVFSLESANPGTANRQGIILNNVFTKGSTNAFVSDDLRVPTQINGAQLPSTVVYAQSELAQSLTSVDSTSAFATPTTGLGFPSNTPASTLTALVGGGQIGATLLTSVLSQVNGVASDHDSVILLNAASHFCQRVVNKSTHILDVYAQVGDTINGQSTNTPVSQAPGSATMYCASQNGIWYGTIIAGTGLNSLCPLGTPCTYTAMQTINLNTGTAPAPVNPAGLEMVGGDAGTGQNIEGNAYASAMAYNAIRRDGTNASPVAVGTNAVVASLSGKSFDGSVVPTNSEGYVRIVTTEAQTTSNHGHDITMGCTPNGTSGTAGVCHIFTALGDTEQVLGGLADGATFCNVFVYGGASHQSSTCFQTTTGVASATTILTTPQDGLVLVVCGSDGTNKFCDQVMFSLTVVTVLSSNTIAGSPAARTYSNTGSGVNKLAMASGTYAVNTSPWGGQR